MYSFEVLVNKFPEILTAKRVLVAFSGGLDSYVLLHSFIAAKQTFPQLQIHAIHMNHGLSKDADVWQQHCTQICENLSVPLIIKKIFLNKEDGGVEERARKARYSFFKEHIEKNDCLLLGHHQDDQAETLLLRLCRGAGIRGMSSIPKSRKFGEGYILRPLLGFSKKELDRYANDNNLSWIEDDSNDDQKFDRNYVRHSILPIIKERWPHFAQAFSRTIEHASEVNILLQELARIDLPKCISSKNSLSINDLSNLSFERQKNVVRFFITELGFKAPSTKHLELIFSMVINAKQDAMPVLKVANYNVRRFDGKLYFINYVDEIDLSFVTLKYNPSQDIELPNGVGVICANQLKGKGLNVAYSDNLTIRFRNGGEKIQPNSSMCTSPLKKLLNTWRVPPWERSNIPLIYKDEELIAVVGHCVSNTYRAKDEQFGWELSLKQAK